MNDPAKTAAFLVDHRARKDPVDNIPRDLYPADLSAAYSVQDMVVENRLQAHGGSPCGYKIACTNPRVVQLLNVSGPFPGRLMTYSTHENGSVLDAAGFRLRIMEAEFGFELARDVPLSEVPYTADSIRPFIGAFVAGLEIVDHCYHDFTRVGEAAIIADNAIHGACVFGGPNKAWGQVDFVRHPVELLVNDRAVSSGIGGNALGNPLYALAWLANHLAGRSIVLRAGERVLTGTAGDIHHAVAGDTVTADFGTLGRVGLSFR